MPITGTGLAWRWAIRARGFYEPVYGTNSLNGTQIVGSAPTTLQLVKTGPITAGTTISSGRKLTHSYGYLPGGGRGNALHADINGSITVAASSCSTSDVLVPMGTHRASEFSAIGGTTGQVSFSIRIDCPAGITGVSAIRYKVDPLTTVLNASQSVVALSAASVATGIGVQLLNGTGTGPLPLSTFQVFSGYTGAGSYSIPLRARYYQTTATVTGGSANSEMEFTIDYQ